MTVELRIHDVVLALREGLGVSRRGIVLFGSRARGNARPDSDWDLLVVADGLAPSPLDRGRDVRQLLPGRWWGRAAIIARTPDEFESQFPAFYLDVAVDGQILYDTEQYLHDRLALIRGRIREAGLERRALDRGFIWVWRQPPPGSWRIDWSGVHGLVG